MASEIQIDVRNTEVNYPLVQGKNNEINSENENYEGNRRNGAIQSDQDWKERNTRTSQICSLLKNNVLLILVVIGVVAGFSLGFGLRSVTLSDSLVMWLGLPGNVFMRVLNLTILPLIVSSIISGTASLDPKLNGKITTATLIYVMVINSTSVMCGVAIFYIINPDKYIVQDNEALIVTNKSVHLVTEDIFADLIRNIFPDNIITSCFEKSQTYYERSNSTAGNSTAYIRKVGQARGTNVLGILIVCTVIGIAAGRMGEVGKSFILFFKVTCEIVISVMKWVIWLTPIGVMSLIATSIAQVNNIENMFKSFGMFFLSVMITVVLNIVGTCLAYFVIIRRNPFKFLYSGLRAMMAGFGPPSSVMAIPDLLYSAENTHHVDNRISRFTVLFCASTVRNGSGAFIVICILFLAGLEGMPLQPGQVVSVVILVIFSILALPSIPSGSVVCVLIVLSSVNVTTTNIGIVMVLEWLLDRFRTASNVLGMLFGSIVIDKFCSKADLVEINIDK